MSEQRQPKPNSGALFENDRKTTDKHLDRKGSLRVTCPACGVEADFWLDGWINRTKEGSAVTAMQSFPKSRRSLSVPTAK
jgi:hypothetical protein